MLFFGHIAISLAVADAIDADPAWAVAGNLLPDVTDKTGGWVLKVMPSGRWLAHGLPFFLTASIAAKRSLPPRASRGFLAGYASHLVADHYGGGRLPLTAPFATAPKKDGGYDLAWLAVNMVPEVLGLAYLGWRRRRKAESVRG